MPRAKFVDKEYIDAFELPSSVSIVCENITIDILMDYEIEQIRPKLTPSLTYHDHATHEILIVEEGSFDVIIANTNLTIKAGEVLLIKPHIEHKLLTHSSNMRRFGMRFNITSSDKDISGALPPYMHYSLNDEERSMIFHLIARLRKSQHTNLSRLDEYRMKAEFGIIISYVLERIAAFDADQKSEDIPKINLYTKIENYFYLNFSRQITLNSIADYFSYSRTQMRRILDKCFAMSFTEKLREIRLSAAKQYLMESDMSIDKIAEKCGYETRQGFEAMFLKHVGMTPNRFRRREKSAEKNK